MASIVVGETCIQATLYGNDRVDVKKEICCEMLDGQLCCSGWNILSLKQLLKLLGEWTSGGRDAVLQWGDVLCCRV